MEKIRVERKRIVITGDTVFDEGLFVPELENADLLLICGANEAPEQQGSIAAKIGQLFIVDILFHEFCAVNKISRIFPEFDD